MWSIYRYDVIVMYVSKSAVAEKGLIVLDYAIT